MLGKQKHGSCSTVTAAMSIFEGTPRRSTRRYMRGCEGTWGHMGVRRVGELYHKFTISMVNLVD